VGVRMAIELQMAGHIVTLVEKRREIRNEDGSLKSLGFTNRINRPHMWPFVRNDLARLNGKDMMSKAAAYPVFTEPETSSIGIDELQCVLIKNALLLGVDFKLGVGYVNATITTDEDSMMPAWQCELSYDGKAAAQFGVEEGKHIEEFDCLIGCDGPRSTVRDTQQKHFGNIEKRKFMDCVGIVTNVQKVNRKRLKELGYEHGQEPADMNRSRMVFKEFFQKIQDEADAEIESLIYYKASFHNYTIIVPRRTDLVKHELSGKVYSFHEGRDGKGAAGEEKIRLRNYCGRILKAAGIPVDPDLENGGFVGVPNDCMAFDFAECWNTKKSLAFNFPPPGYSVAEDGPWSGKRLTPFVCLAGDSLLEPFWPLGLGLKRGWQAIMDTAWAVDNLFNRTCFCDKPGREVADPDAFTWEEHYEALQEQCASNFEMCNRLAVGADLGRGEYDDNGLMMKQLKMKWKDADKPNFEVEVDPWTRYAPLERQSQDVWKKLSKEEQAAIIHPVVRKSIAKRDFIIENSSGKDGILAYIGKKLVTVNGKVPVYAVKKDKAETSDAPKKIMAAPKSKRGKK